MAKRLKKQSENKSIGRVGCAQLHQRDNNYMWVCGVNGTVIISQPALKMDAKNYEARSAKRLAETQAALDAHKH